MKKLLFTLILATICGISAFAYSFSVVCESGQTLYYNITSNTEPYTVSVTSRFSDYPYYSTFPTGDLTIPETVEYNSITYSVTSIGNNAFCYCRSLTSVTIPNSVTSIGESAFYECSELTSIIIPNSAMSIGDSAFGGCGLTSITIPNSVTSIGNGAFYGCSGLTSPVYNANCFAYFPCGYATSYTIPNGIQQIVGSAFRDCSGLTSVTIPNSVTSIGEYAFHYCIGLTTVNFNATNCTGMGNPDFPVFENCPSLSTLNIGDNVTNIPDYAFYGCSGLTSVTIPNSVTSIGEYAFDECHGLTEITIPNSVTSIGDFAFFYCSGLTAVNFNATNCTSMGPNVWNACSSFTTLNIGDNVTNIPDYAFFYCSGLTSVTIGNGVTSIGEAAFHSCSGLTSVTIGNGVTSIGEAAFHSCSGLETITIGNSVSSIGNDVFAYCIGLTSITSYAIVPPQAAGLFYNVPTDVPVYVPCATKQAYQNADGWSDFTNIQIIEGETFHYTATVSVAEGNEDFGSVEILRQPDCDDATFKIIALPNEDYRFLRWTDGNTSNPRSVIVTNDIDISAVFAYNRFEIETMSNDENMGTVRGGGIYGYGDVVGLTAIANEGYIFVRWNDGNTENPRNIVVRRDSTFTATFGILNEITINDCNNYDLGGGYNFYETGTHYVFFTNAEGVDSVVCLNLTIEQPIETSIRVVATNESNRNVVTWNPVSNNTMLGYLLYRQDAYGEYEVVDTVAIDAECSWTDEVSNTAVRPYRYAVATYDSCGNISAMSDSHRTIHLQISLGQGNSRNLSWTDYEGIDFSTYRVYRGTSIDDMEMIMEMSRENHTYTDFNTEHDYYYQIEIVQGRSLIISKSNIVSSNPNAIETEQMSAEIALFPNPASDILNITSSETISEIEIVNVMGQVVKRIEVNSDNAVCDVEELKAGVYVVRISTASATLSQQRFIKE